MVWCGVVWCGVAWRGGFFCFFFVFFPFFFKCSYVWLSDCTHGRVSGPSSLLDQEVIAPCGYSVPCQFWPVVRRHGRGVLWAGGDPCMTGCLEGPLASPVLAQSWSQTATDEAWSSTTALLSGRDRARCLCVLRLSGSEPKTRRTGSVATSLPSNSLLVARAGNVELDRYPQLMLPGAETR